MGNLKFFISCNMLMTEELKQELIPPSIR